MYWVRSLPRRRNLVVITLSLLVLLFLVDFTLFSTKSSSLISSRISYISGHKNNKTRPADISLDDSISETNSSLTASKTPLKEDEQISIIDEDPFYQGLCTNYFHNLYDFDDFWGIEVYNGPKQHSNMVNTKLSIRHVRSYINCFLRNSVKVKLNMTDLEQRLLPAFHHVFPQFKRYDGTIVEGRFPNSVDYNRISKRYESSDKEHKEELRDEELRKEQENNRNEEQDSENERIEKEKEDELNEQKEKEQREQEEQLRKEKERQEEEERQRYNEHLANYSYWRDIREQANGRGIVFSLGEGRSVGELQRLLHVLRMQGNTLPIQVVYKNDLSEESINSLIDAARAPFVLSKRHTEKRYPNIITNPQDIWFVNSHRCIKESAYGLFERFNNKWLAVLFNSFDEMILMDTDSVPFVPLDEMFDLPPYVDTQAYLFQDRVINYDRISHEDSAYIRSILPSEEESKLFKMKPLTNMSYKNPITDGNIRSRHFVESGMVIISRKKHLPELLMSTSLQFLTPASGATYGDKEMFWLGFSASGSEDYYVNPLPAGGIGVREPGEGTRRDGSKFKYNITSGIQPAHLSPDHRLLWVNSGMTTCKFDDCWGTDYNDHHEIREKYPSPLDWKEHLESPLKADGVMLIEERLTEDEFNSIQVHELGFKVCADRGCAEYTWCAFDTEDRPGEWVPFDEETEERFRKVSDYWNRKAIYLHDED